MDNTMTSLAFSVYSNPGVFALLVGSGVSRSSGIFTGWDITLDLVKKLAASLQEDCGTDPEGWYQERFKKNPNYSEILGSLLKTSAERTQLLRTYFERTEEDQDNQLKLPTQAHHAIASLVMNGYIKVIVTTNFDHLLEDAIRLKGIEPTIVSTSDAVDGMLPLAHIDLSRCIIIKVNGDYLDCRIKNTSTELESYDNKMNTLLDHVFDSFGLVVCGWSAEWDIALSSAVQKCNNHRFSTYWCDMDGLTNKAQNLVTLRRANIVKIQDADAFFTDLESKVFALKDIDGHHPLSPKLASAIVKRYIVDESSIIKLHDFAYQEIEDLYQEINSDKYPVVFKTSLTNTYVQELRKRFNIFESLTEICLSILITGCYWGNTLHNVIWVKCIERICNQPFQNNSESRFMRARLYPGLILTYAAGIASLASNDYESFATVMSSPSLSNIKSDVDFPIEFGIVPNAILEEQAAIDIFSPGRNYIVPISEHLFELLRSPFKDVILDDDKYQYFFNKFEYLRALLLFNLTIDRDTYAWYPYGRYVYDDKISNDIYAEIEKMDSSWPLLKLGLFSSSLDRLRWARDAFNAELKKQKAQW